MAAVLDRAAATARLVARLRDEVVVSNLGQATFDLQRLGDRPLNCYTYGSMGQCSSIALGIALARPDVRVISLDGDGSLLMNLGVLCTIGTLQPRNLALVVWDNEAHVTTGGQPTATAFRASIVQLARGAGIETALEVRDEAALERAYDRMLAEDGPFLLVAKVTRARTEAPPDRDVVGHARRFRQALAAVPAAR